jgi:hypothetical protein
MFGFIDRAIRKRRVVRYLKALPEDVTVVQAILAALEFKAKSPRDAAEMMAGRELTDAERVPMSLRWERPWYGVK